jgi:hypothetical protein
LIKGGHPLFLHTAWGRPVDETPTELTPEDPAVANAEALSLEVGRRLRSRVAGIFLFLPFLARLRFEGSVRMPHDDRDVVEKEVSAGTAATPSQVSYFVSDLIGPCHVVVPDCPQMCAGRHG